MAKQYVVTAPYITLTVPTPDGPTIKGFYEGAPVPDGVSEESIKHHLDNDLIAEAEDAEPSEQPKGNASLGEWQAYATASGMTADELEGLTRDQIRDLYVTP